MEYDINDLEADGIITIYRLDDGKIVKQYEGLEVYEVIEKYLESYSKLKKELQRVKEKLEKYESAYFICPDCEYKISPDEFLTDGKKYKEESWPKEEDYL
jgi:hypothetical protein